MKYKVQKEDVTVDCVVDIPDSAIGVTVKLFSEMKTDMWEHTTTVDGFTVAWLEPVEE